MNLMDKMTDSVYQSLKGIGRHKLAEMYRKCYKSTWETTLQQDEDGTVFLITGDIPAMWLRDSSAQVQHYLPFAKQYDQVAEVIEQLLKRQFFCINIDPYANAFNKEANANRYATDRAGLTPEQEPWIWERKYEIDSLCYPIKLAYDFWKQTGRTGWYGEEFVRAVHKILDLWETEQRHGEESSYFFERDNCPASDTLPFEGKGAPVSYTGMTWSGFRPSDDACRYGYLIPANLFAVNALEKLQELVRALGPDPALLQRAEKLAEEIRRGIQAYGIVEHEKYGKIYAYETDGMGNHVLMDDANVPSLLSLPYLGCCAPEDEIYQNTRRFILSPENPYYYEGTAAKGIGSPHTPENYVWNIALCMQGLTSTDAGEVLALVDMLEQIDAGTDLMHEGIDVNNPQNFTRPWFAWANSLFSEFVQRRAVDCLLKAQRV